MNIFCLDSDPIKAAQYMADVHTGSANFGGKMICETGQMLANAYTLERLAQPDCPRSQSGNSRRHSYRNHPCTIWARSSLGNFMWLVEHGLAMSEEKMYRGGAYHFTTNFIKWCQDNIPDLDGDITPFAQAMPDKYKNVDSVTAYRTYYTKDKMVNLDCTWTKRGKPDWL